MRYVIGIDAGGTKTTGILADETGRELREARAGGANLRVQGELGVEKSLYQVLEALNPPGAVDALCLGIAGVAGDTERGIVRDLLRRLGIRRAVRIVNDAVVALVAGAPEGLGVVLISGTGSIAWGVNASGQTARSGGWGYLLGDEGSAFWLGHAAVRQGIRAADGRGAATTLYELICNRLGVRGTPDLVDWFYDQELSRTRVAELARIVEEAANDGDLAAEDLLDQAAGHLARAARAVAQTLAFPQPFPLVLSGGAFRACPSLVPRIEARLHLPLARVLRLDAAPASGAVRLALAMLDQPEGAPPEGDDTAAGEPSRWGGE